MDGFPQGYFVWVLRRGHRLHGLLAALCFYLYASKTASAVNDPSLGIDRLPFWFFYRGILRGKKTKDAGDVLRPDYGACFVRRAGLGQRGENGAAFYILCFGGLFFHASFGSYRRNLGSKQKKQAKIVFCASFFPALWYNKI